MLATLVCATTLSTPASPHAVIAKAGFPVYGFSKHTIGYKLTQAQVHEIHGGKKVLRLTYSNNASRDTLDLLQMPTGGGATPASRFKSIVKTGYVPLAFEANTTFVAGRKGKTDIGLFGTLLTKPSAEKLLQKLVKVS